MASRRDLVDFVQAALAAGHDHAEIRVALTEAGWAERDADRALAHFARTGFRPPVPRPRPFATGRDAVLYGLTFFALSVVVVNVTSVLFDLVDTVTRAETLTLSGLSWEVAALVVFAPLFVVLDLRTRRDERDNPVRKTFAYVALFFAALVILMTLVAVVALALSGGLGAEVGLKALAVAVIAAAVFLYYRSDLVRDTERR